MSIEKTQPPWNNRTGTRHVPLTGLKSTMSGTWRKTYAKLSMSSTRRQGLKSVKMSKLRRAVRDSCTYVRAGASMGDPGSDDMMTTVDDT